MAADPARYPTGPTQPQRYGPPPQPPGAPAQPPRSGVRPATLLAAALASVAAAIITSHFWQAGTLLSTALTPVIVSVLKEWLQRPAERVTAAPVSAARAVRSRRGDTGTWAPRTAGAQASASPAEPVAQETAPGPAGDWEPDEGSRPARGARRATREVGPPSAQLTPYRVFRRPLRHRWRLAVVTGLLGFVLCVAVLTIPELVAGRAVTGGSSGTTIFGGSARSAPDSSKDGQQGTTTDTAPARDGQQTQPSSTTPQRESTTPSSTTPSSTTRTTPSPGTTTPSQSTPSSTTPSPATPRTRAPSSTSTSP